MTVTTNTKQNRTQCHIANIPEYVKAARVKLDNGANKADVIEEVLNQFVLGMAKDKFGTQLETARFMAKSLESLSKTAKSGEYSKLIEGSTFFELWDWYDRTYDLIGPLYMKFFAPDALAYHEFIDICSRATLSATISPSCPACKQTKLEYAPDFIIDRATTHIVSVVCECSHCGFSPTLDIKIVKPQSEHESLTRSYIRSLLIFEQYDKDHGLGPIHEHRTLVSVAEQAAKALVHLPDSFTTDYQQLVKEEMAR